MATTAGNSNSPRLGVPITIRSAPNSSSCGRVIPTAKTMKTENAVWHRLLDALMIGPTRSNHSLTNRQFLRCPSRSTEIRIFCFLDSGAHHHGDPAGTTSGDDEFYSSRTFLLKSY